MTLIDFGSVGTLSRPEVKSIMKAIIGAAAGNADLLNLGFYSLLERAEGQSEEEFSQLLETFSAYIKNRVNPNNISRVHTASKIIEDVLNQGLSLGLAIPENIWLFYRGKKFIEDQLLLAHSQIPEANRKNTPDVMYYQILKKNFCKDIWWTVGEAQNDKQALIDNEVVITLFGHYTRAGCSSVAGAFTSL